MTIDGGDDCDGGACCTVGESACVFSKALIARHAACTCVRRRAVGERELMDCGSPVARTNCLTLAALLRERATFALKLPRHGAPMVHAKALQLQCGGLLALRSALGAETPDVHGMVTGAMARWGSLLDAPWGDIVPAIVQWQPRRRGRPAAP